MSYELEPAIWSRDTGQRITCFDKCQLIITWMSNIQEIHGKPRLHARLSTVNFSLPTSQSSEDGQLARRQRIVPREECSLQKNSRRVKL